MKLRHSSSSSDNFSWLWPADWKFGNIWHDTDMICWSLIGPCSQIDPSHWPVVTIQSLYEPDTHNTGLSLAANTWACLWESRSFQTEPSLPRTLLHWPLTTTDRCRHQLSDVITFGQTFIMCQHCAIERLDWRGQQVSSTCLNSSCTICTRMINFNCYVWYWI